MREWAKALLVVVAGLGVVAVLLVATSRFYRVTSPAMESTLHCERAPDTGCEGGSADRIWVSRVLYKLRDPQRSDLVAFKLTEAEARQCGLPSKETSVMRIVGLPGERWSGKNGTIYINGEELEEPYVKPDRGPQNLQVRKIPAGHYVVLGDNRNESCDSRIIGPLARKRMVGPVVAVYWPLKRISIR